MKGQGSKNRYRMTSAAACDHKQGWKSATFAILRAMRSPTSSILKACALLLLCAIAAAADGPAHRWDCGVDSPPAASQVQGRLLILPGVGNTRFHLAGFVAAAEA